MSQVIVLSEDLEINGVPHRAGEFVIVFDGFDQDKIRRKVVGIADVEERNKRRLKNLRIPAILERAPEETREALNNYLGRFPNDVDAFSIFDFAIITPDYVDNFIDALRNRPGKIKRLLRSPGDIDKILRITPPGRGN